MPSVLVIPDLHAPWMHEHAVDFLADLRRRHRPSEVVCLGDEIDAHRWTSHAQEPEAPGPGDELDQAKKALKPIFKLFPTVKVCISNHTIRPWKRGGEVGLPAAFFREMRDVLGAPKTWRWEHWWDVQGVHFRHGDGFSGKNAALTAAERVRRPVAIGHVHSHAGVQYSAGLYDTLWGMNCGCLIDPKALVFNYGRYQAARPVLGAAVIADGVPMFVPLKPKEEASGQAT